MSECAIVAHRLTRRFGDVIAVNAINLQVPKAIVYGFLGPNGSGKSTTIRMLCGLLTPSAGDITVLGYQIPEQAEALKRRIGYMTQKFSLFEDLTVQENLQFLAAIQELPRQAVKPRIDDLLGAYGLRQLRDRLAGTLSGGEKQRLALAGAVIHQPELLLLDEPTSAVDPESRRDFWEKLFQLVDQGTTILVSTHYMDEAERCHRLVILDRGILAADGAPDALRDALMGRVAVVETPSPRPARQLLSALPNALGVAQIGSQLRVLARSSNDFPGAVEQTLANAGIQAQVALERPNLEDVFVAVTRGRELASA